MSSPRIVAYNQLLQNNAQLAKLTKTGGRRRRYRKTLKRRHRRKRRSRYFQAGGNTVVQPMTNSELFSKSVPINQSNANMTALHQQMTANSKYDNVPLQT